MGHGHRVDARRRSRPSRATPTTCNAIIFDTVYWTSLADPTDGCPGVAAADDYNPQTNPDGVRCTLADYMINVFGPRPQSVWTPAEKAIGHGFAGLPIDNVGVQYGLDGAREGRHHARRSSLT